MTIPFAGSISKRDFSRVKSLLLPVWARWYVFAPCAVLFFISTGSGWSAAIARPLSAAWDVGSAALTLLGCAAITHYGRARAWRNMLALSGKVHGAVTDSGIEWKTANTTSTYEWAKLIKARHDGDLSLLFYTPRCAFYFPREFFASEQDWQSFQATVQSKIKQ